MGAASRLFMGGGNGDPVPLNPAGEAPAGFFDTVKNVLSNIVGVVLVVIVVLATIVSAEIMIPVLAVYGIWKFIDALLGDDSQEEKNKQASSFWFWLFLVIVALAVYWLKSRK